MAEIIFDVNNKKETFYTSGGEVCLSQKHSYKEDSLCWKFYKGDFFTVNTPVILKENLKYPTGIKCRIYNETPGKSVIRFEFGTDGKEDLSFYYFSGWKEVALTYERGFMKGTYSNKMNYFKVSATEGSGEIYISDIQLSEILCPSHLYAKMAPQIKDLPLPTRRGAMGSFECHNSLINKPIFPSEPLTEKLIRGFDDVLYKYFELMDEIDNPPFVRGTMEYDSAVEIFDSYDITYNADIVKGRCIENTAVYAKAMKAIALNFQKYCFLEDADRFILMWRHLRDQNTQINWYYGRGVGSALLIMKKELLERGLLSETIEYLKTAYNFSKVYMTSSKDVVTYAKFEDTDVIGMDLPSMLSCILLMENLPEKVRDMRHFVYYIENFCLGYAPGLASGYKPDGTAFHHCGYIRQYETVANYSMSRVLYALSQTPFMINTEAINRFKNTLRTTFTMYNGVYEPFTICQYAFDYKWDTSVVEFAHAAKAFKDDELARMYVTLAACSEKEQKNPYYRYFLEKGIKPIKEFSEHKTLSYVAAAFHRRKNWTVAVRGHSKYVYPMEIWPDEGGTDKRAGKRYTAFSLYRSFGFLEILYSPEFEGGTNNAIYIDKGFDFCRWPGSTAVHVPLSRIKSKPHLVEDELSEWLLSDRGYVGGLDTEDKNGVFAMQIHGPHKYGLESFEATKTYHFYENIIVCLGSGITSDIEKYSVETTMFQDFGTGAVQNGNILLDKRENGYMVFDGEDNIRFYTEDCISRDIKDYEDTKGVRTFAFFDHGKAPQNAHYGYILKIGQPCTQEDAIVFKKNIMVLKQDASAHIVRIFDKTNYTFFRKAYDMEDRWISSVSQSCIVSVSENKNEVSLAVCDPDLRFYLGESEDYDINRKKEEKSIYGRFWVNQESMPSHIWIVLNHSIEAFKIIKGNAKIIQSYDNKTIMEFICKDGLTNEITFYINE